jgi:penicillin-binding protein 2
LSYSKLSHPLDDRLHRQITGTRLLLLFFLAFSGLAARLFYLQITKGAYHEKLSLQNSVRVQVVKAPRGTIYDRHGNVLARNRPSYQVALLPTQIKKPAQIRTTLAKFRDSTGTRIFDSALVDWSLDRARWRKFQPLILFEDAPLSLVSQIEEHQIEMPGVSVIVESRRAYPYGKAASHVLGYMDEVKEEELQALRKTGDAEDSLLYQRGDRIGRKGLERIYEKDFRGRDGVRYVKVNAFGKVIETIGELPEIKAKPGSDLWTSLDIELQTLAESLMTDTVKGSVVVMDPRSGEVLVMTSSPRMDGNIFSLSKERRNKEWARLVFDPMRPLSNRAVSGGYEPASTFKALVSLAGLESGRIGHKQLMTRSCKGGYQFGSRYWRCWDPKGHGFTDMYSAFMVSCDTYYYQVGLNLGMDRINQMARRFGMAAKTGIDLDDERSGELIDSASYEEKFRKRRWRWTPGLTLNLSIGQGQIITPLQLGVFASGLATGKNLYRPHLMQSVRERDGSVLRENTPQVMGETGISSEHHDMMLEAMYQVVSGPRGTGGRARVEGVKVGGKTGSAENPHGDLTHALFIGVAPLDNPEIVVAVVMENVGGGGSIAAPVAGEILRRYFSRKTRG